MLFAAAMGPVTVFGGFWLLGGFDTKPAASIEQPGPSANTAEPAGFPKTAEKPASLEQIAEKSPSPKETSPPKSKSPEKSPAAQIPVVVGNPPEVEDFTIPEIHSLGWQSWLISIRWAPSARK
jgi:hypothetical protein